MAAHYVALRPPFALDFLLLLLLLLLRFVERKIRINTPNISQQLDINVFSLALKTSSEMPGDRSSVGKLFRQLVHWQRYFSFRSQSSCEERVELAVQTWRIADETDQGRMMLVCSVMPGQAVNVIVYHDQGSRICSVRYVFYFLKDTYVH